MHTNNENGVVRREFFDSVYKIAVGGSALVLTHSGIVYPHPQNESLLFLRALDRYKSLFLCIENGCSQAKVESDDKNLAVHYPAEFRALAGSINAKMPSALKWDESLILRISETDAHGIKSTLSLGDENLDGIVDTAARHYEGIGSGPTFYLRRLRLSDVAPLQEKYDLGLIALRTKIETLGALYLGIQYPVEKKDTHTIKVQKKK